MTILIDASVFCAYVNENDVHHGRSVALVKDVLAHKYGKAITTDYIFDEAVTVALRRSTKKNAVELGNFILHSEVFFVKIDSGVFQKAWDIFQKEEGLSFTDCTLLAFMKSFDIMYIATFDKEFKKIAWLKVVDG